VIDDSPARWERETEMATDGAKQPANSPFWLTRAEWRWLLVLLVVGLGLRIALIYGLHTYVIPPKDNHYLFAHEYGRVARVSLVSSVALAVVSLWTLRNWQGSLGDGSEESSCEGQVMR
jgi:hypothetical protein